MTSAVASILGAIDQLSTAEHQELMVGLFQRQENSATPSMDSPFQRLDQTAAKSLLQIAQPILFWILSILFKSFHICLQCPFHSFANEIIVH
jgi:hypothetical protein